MNVLIIFCHAYKLAGDELVIISMVNVTDDTQGDEFDHFDLTYSAFLDLYTSDLPSKNLNTAKLNLPLTEEVPNIIGSTVNKFNLKKGDVIPGINTCSGSKPNNIIESLSSLSKPCIGYLSSHNVYYDMTIDNKAKIYNKFSDSDVIVKDKTSQKNTKDLVKERIDGLKGTENVVHTMQCDVESNSNAKSNSYPKSNSDKKIIDSEEHGSINSKHRLENALELKTENTNVEKRTNITYKRKKDNFTKNSKLTDINNNGEIIDNSKIIRLENVNVDDNSIHVNNDSIEYFEVKVEASDKCIKKLKRKNQEGIEDEVVDIDNKNKKIKKEILAEKSSHSDTTLVEQCDMKSITSEDDQENSDILFISQKRNNAIGDDDEDDVMIIETPSTTIVLIDISTDDDQEQCVETKSLSSHNTEIEILDVEQYTKKLEKIKKSCPRLEDINKIRISGEQMEKYVKLPMFSTVVIGCFVKLKIFRPSGNSFIKMTEILDVVETDSYYQFGSIRTNAGIKIRSRIYNQVFPLSNIIDNNFLDHEYIEWLEECCKNDYQMPTVQHIFKKETELIKIENYQQAMDNDPFCLGNNDYADEKTYNETLCLEDKIPSIENPYWLKLEKKSIIYCDLCKMSNFDPKIILYHIVSRRHTLKAATSLQSQNIFKDAFLIETLIFNQVFTSEEQEAIFNYCIFFKCPSCEITFDTVRKMINHFNEVCHSDMEVMNESFQSLYNTILRMLEIFVNKVYWLKFDKYSRFNCTLCQKYIQTSKEIIYHIISKKHTSNSASSLNSENILNDAFLIRTLITHQNFKTKQRETLLECRILFKCPICKYKLDTIRMLVEHFMKEDHLDDEAIETSLGNIFQIILEKNGISLSKDNKLENAEDGVGKYIQEANHNRWLDNLKMQESNNNQDFSVLEIPNTEARTVFEKPRKPRGTKKKKVKDETMPKRPMSTFFLWLTENRDQIEKDNPCFTIKELSKKAGELWSALEDKTKWEELQVKGKEEYIAKMKEWKSAGGGQKAVGDDDDVDKPKKAKAKITETPTKSLGSPPKSGSGGGFKSAEFILDDSSDEESECDEKKKKTKKIKKEEEEIEEPLKSTEIKQQNSQAIEENHMQQVLMKQESMPESITESSLKQETMPESIPESSRKKCFLRCGGNWYDLMLECRRCKQWFHEACVGCLKHKLIYGDRFYLYVCEFCNNGNEFIHRLPISWEDIVHLALWNLLLSTNVCENGMYFDYKEQIVPWVNNHWELLQCPHDFQPISLNERSQKIFWALQSNSNKFVCGKKFCNNARILKYKLKMKNPPSVHDIILPPESPFTDAMMDRISYSEKLTELTPIPETFKIDATETEKRGFSKPQGQAFCTLDQEKMDDNKVMGSTDGECEEIPIKCQKKNDESKENEESGPSVEIEKIIRSSPVSSKTTSMLFANNLEAALKLGTVSVGDGGMTHICNVCNLSSQGREPMITHIGGKKHMKAVRCVLENGEIESRELESKDVFMENRINDEKYNEHKNNNGIDLRIEGNCNVYDEKIQGSHELSNGEIFYCEICKMNFSNFSEEQKHYDTVLIHKIRNNPKTLENDWLKCRPYDLFDCHICNVVNIKGHLNLMYHLIGRIHHTLAVKSKKLEMILKDGHIVKMALLVEAAIRKNELHRNLLWKYFCNKCKIDLPLNIMDCKMHLEIEHRICITIIEKELEKPKLPKFKRVLLHNVHYQCPICDVKLGNLKHMYKHFKEEDHLIFEELVNTSLAALFKTSTDNTARNSDKESKLEQKQNDVVEVDESDTEEIFEEPLKKALDLGDIKWYPLTKVYKCLLCDFIFANKQVAYSHLKGMKHRNELRLKIMKEKENDGEKVISQQNQSTDDTNSESNMISMAKLSHQDQVIQPNEDPMKSAIKQMAVISDKLERDKKCAPPTTSYSISKNGPTKRKGILGEPPTFLFSFNPYEPFILNPSTNKSNNNDGFNRYPPFNQNASHLYNSNCFVPPINKPYNFVSDNYKHHKNILNEYSQYNNLQKSHSSVYPGYNRPINVFNETNQQTEHREYSRTNETANIYNSRIKETHFNVYSRCNETEQTNTNYRDNYKSKSSFKNSYRDRKQKHPRDTIHGTPNVDEMGNTYGSFRKINTKRPFYDESIQVTEKVRNAPNPQIHNQNYDASTHSQNYDASKNSQNYGVSKNWNNYGASTHSQNYDASTPRKNYGASKSIQDYNASTQKMTQGQSTHSQNYDTQTNRKNHYVSTHSQNYDASTHSKVSCTSTHRKNYDASINSKNNGASTISLNYNASTYHKNVEFNHSQNHGASSYIPSDTTQLHSQDQVGAADIQNCDTSVLGQNNEDITQSQSNDLSTYLDNAALAHRQFHGISTDRQNYDAPISSETPGTSIHDQNCEASKYSNNHAALINTQDYDASGHIQNSDTSTHNMNQCELTDIQNFSTASDIKYHGTLTHIRDQQVQPLKEGENDICPSTTNKDSENGLSTTNKDTINKVSPSITNKDSENEHGPSTTSIDSVNKVSPSITNKDSENKLVSSTTNKDSENEHVPSTTDKDSINKDRHSITNKDSENKLVYSTSNPDSENKLSPSTINETNLDSITLPIEPCNVDHFAGLNKENSPNDSYLYSRNIQDGSSGLLGSEVTRSEDLNPNNKLDYVKVDQNTSFHETIQTVDDTSSLKPFEEGGGVTDSISIHSFINQDSSNNVPISEVAMPFDTERQKSNTRNECQQIALDHSHELASPGKMSSINPETPILQQETPKLTLLSPQSQEATVPYKLSPLELSPYQPWYINNSRLDAQQKRMDLLTLFNPSPPPTHSNMAQYISSYSPMSPFEETHESPLTKHSTFFRKKNITKYSPDCLTSMPTRLNCYSSNTTSNNNNIQTKEIVENGLDEGAIDCEKENRQVIKDLREYVMEGQSHKLLPEQNKNSILNEESKYEVNEKPTLIKEENDDLNEGVIDVKNEKRDITHQVKQELLDETMEIKDKSGSDMISNALKKNTILSACLILQNYYEDLGIYGPPLEHVVSQCLSDCKNMQNVIQMADFNPLMELLVTEFEKLIENSEDYIHKKKYSDGLAQIYNLLLLSEEFVNNKI